MGHLTTPSEHELLEELASEYRAAGYTVTLEPRGLPDDFSVRPDLLAERGAEKVIVEVTRASGANWRSKWAELAAAAERHGWRFRLVLVGPDRDSTLDYASVLPEDIETKLATAESLSTTSLDASVLLAWAGFEAAARRSLLLLETAAPRSQSTVSLAKSLVHHGLLEQEDLAVLVPIAQRRNALAHGAPASGVTKDDVAHLAALGRQLLAAA